MLGCKYGTHRAIEPRVSLPQPAIRVDNDMKKIYDNEILIDVETLNIDSASFTQLKEEAGGDKEKIKSRIMEIVDTYGKMKNPVTGSGGMLLGKVMQIGESLKEKFDLEEGDYIATLVSLSLTPLKIDKIHSLDLDVDRVSVSARAILFESGLYAKVPKDLDPKLSLAAMDVAGAPAQVSKLVKSGQRVLILGAGGKSGLLCCYEAMKRVGQTGRVIGLDANADNARRLEELGFCKKVILEDATNPVKVLNSALEANDGLEFDIAINCLNVPGCEMSCILPVRDEGIVYFFSMATSFTQAALGAEGVGKDVTMIVGNGYTKGHAKITFDDLRECESLRKMFEDLYVE